MVRVECLTLVALAALLSASCQRKSLPPPPESEPAAEDHQMPLSPREDETEDLARLAEGGRQAFASLQAHQDIHHGASWFQGAVPVAGSTAYLYLGKLGETGSSTLRFVVRYEGSQPANLSNCTVIVDGSEIASFSPAPNRVDQPTDGSVRQLADIHFDDVRTAVLAMIKGQTAVIRSADGKEIRLGRPELDEMSRVLSAYLHLQGKPSSAQ